MDEYDIQEAFAAIEKELIKSMMRNMARHRVEEIAEEKEWAMWQAEQLKALDQYRKNNQKNFKKKFSEINTSISDAISQASQLGSMDQEVEILEAIKQGYKKYSFPTRLRQIISNNKGKSLKEIIDMLFKRNIPAELSGSFFRLNDRKLEALIQATKRDMLKAEIAMLRMANDQYRKIIFNAQMYANTGAATYEKAVDMAAKDFLSAGINCIEYKNGTRVNIASYARMALQTASKRAYLAGEGEKRQEWGISTVIMNKRGAACPKCLPFVGKVFMDDVWSGGKASDGPYPLLSSAIAAGLYHPNCKDSHTTYFEGITTPPKLMTQADIDKVTNNYRLEQRQKYNDRMMQKYKALAENSLDDEDRIKYEWKYKEWQMLSKFSKGQKVRPIAKAVPDGIINNKEWLKAEFSSPKKLAKHMEKHLHQYENMTEADYVGRAKELLAADLSEDIEGFVDNEGFVFKYSKSANDFAIGRPDGKISTLYKPDEALEYWKGERIKYEPKN